MNEDSLMMSGGGNIIRWGCPMVAGHYRRLQLQCAAATELMLLRRS